MPPGRFPGPPGSKVTSLARRHRAADVGFTRYRPNQGGSISETSREDALNEPSEWNIILEKEMSSVFGRLMEDSSSPLHLRDAPGQARA